MGLSRQVIRAHRRSATLFLIWLGAAWALTLATWVFDENGMTVGMHPLGALLTLLLPMTAGSLLGWWRRGAAEGRRGIGAGVGAGALGGLLALEATLLGETALWLVIYHWLLGRPLAPTGSLLAGLLTLGEFAILAGVAGLVLGALGGLIGGPLAGAADGGTG